MRKFLTISALAVASVMIMAVALIVMVGVFYVWRFHPWVPSGRAFALGRWRFEDCEFQVWQRKNSSIVEPFADGLFVRQGTNQWQAFCFDIQDRYSPRVRLVQEGGQILVYRDGEIRGAYILKTHTFQRHGHTYEPDGIGASSNPPGDWWLKIALEP